MAINIFRFGKPFKEAITTRTDKFLVMGWWRVLNLKSTRATARALIIHTAPRVGEVWQFLQSTVIRCGFCDMIMKEK